MLRAIRRFIKRIFRPLPVMEDCVGCGNRGCEWCGQGEYA